MYLGQFSIPELVSKGTLSDLCFRFREGLGAIILMQKFSITLGMRLALVLNSTVMLMLVLGLLVVVQSRKGVRVVSVRLITAFSLDSGSLSSRISLCVDLTSFIVLDPLQLLPVSWFSKTFRCPKSRQLKPQINWQRQRLEISTCVFSISVPRSQKFDSHDIFDLAFQSHMMWAHFVRSVTVQKVGKMTGSEVLRCRVARTLCTSGCLSMLM